jgi:hypothetical protein
MTTWMLPPLTWHIFQIIVDVFSLIMFVYVFSQSKGHSLLRDALNFTICNCLKLKEKRRISISFDNFIEKESIVALELGFLAFNIQKKFMVF